jgi:hypothetical protein
MPKQIKLVGEGLPELTSYSGEPKEKFFARMKKQGHNPNDPKYDYKNIDVEIDEEGLVIVGKMMLLFDKLKKHVVIKNVSGTLDMDTGEDKLIKRLDLQKPPEVPAVAEVKEKPDEPESVGSI